MNLKANDIQYFADNSDLIACTVVLKDGTRMHRFLVIDVIQLILVEPTRRLGYGVAKLVGFLQVRNCIFLSVVHIFILF